MTLLAAKTLTYTVRVMENFQATVEDFLVRNPEVAASTLGVQALGDSAFVKRLREGMDPRQSTMLRITKWMADYVETKRRAARNARRRRADLGTTPR